MKIEFEINDTDLRAMIERNIRDYVYDNRMVSSLCRQAIYELTADAAEKIIKDSPEKLATLVLGELTQILGERRDN